MSSQEEGHSAANDALREPHAYAVETLWNRGGWSERWGLSMEMDEISQPIDRDEAERVIAEMIEDGHAPDAVRLVALVVVDSVIPPVVGQEQS